MSGIRAATMNRSPASSSPIKLAADSMLASATTVTSGSWCAVAKAPSMGSMVLVSALLPSKEGVHDQREGAHIGQQPDNDLRV
jgi:hypothetical protein